MRKGRGSGMEGSKIVRRRTGRLGLLAKSACVVIAWCASLSSAFVLIPSVWLCTDQHRLGPRLPAQLPTSQCSRVPELRMAGQGFGTPTPPSSSKSSERTISSSDQGLWENEYKAYVKRTGQYLCSMSWEGYEEMGRGAIFANYDDAKKGDMLNDADRFGGIPSMYIPLPEFESMQAAENTGEDYDLEQIISRVTTYRPDTEFVVVFQAAGVMGTDIVRPNVPPPEMAKCIVKQEAAAVKQSSDEDGGIIDVTPLEE